MSENAYFASDPSSHSTERGQFVRVEAEIEPLQFAAGLAFRPVLGRRLLASFVRFEPHAEAPLHSHEEEQMTIVLEGELDFEVGGETRLLQKGDVAVSPPHVPHAAKSRDAGCLEIDVFSPPREAMVQLMAEQAKKGSAPAPMRVVGRSRVEELYHLIDAGDVDAAMELFSADAVYERPGAGALEGREAIRDFYQTGRGIQSSEHNIDELLVDGDRIAARGTLEAIRDDGGKIATVFMDVFFFREGLIANRSTFVMAPLS